jgi:2-dehydro-3-deoxygalactonokinase
MDVRAKTQWIAVDWGTSNLRVFALDADNALLAERASDRGMGGLEPAAFEGALLELIGDFLRDGHKMPVVCCGMVGARQGWIEASYLATPCRPPAGDVATCVIALDSRIDVMILPGMKQMSPADVMRGEETQVAGYLRENPKFDGILLMPGTHSKWVHVSAQEIISFQTFMTGELFALLAKQSVLRHSIADNGWDDAAFGAAVTAAISKPESVAANLFSLRAGSLVGDQSPQAARARLSGLLIGLELAAARPYWLGQKVAIIGAPEVGAIYANALRLQGLEASILSAKSMTLAGLVAAYQILKEQPV